MNRRQFLKFTVSIAAAAALNKVAFSVLDAQGLHVVPPPPPWIPTQAEVDQWLEYYKICMANRGKTFFDIVTRSFGSDDVEESLEGIAAAERDFDLLSRDRLLVGSAQGWGYEAGYHGAPRLNEAFKAPSHPAYGWYNYWQVGVTDRNRRLSRGIAL